MVSSLLAFLEVCIKVVDVYSQGGVYSGCWLSWTLVEIYSQEVVFTQVVDCFRP